MPIAQSSFSQVYQGLEFAHLMAVAGAVPARP